MVWGGRREEGSEWGTCVYLWWIRVDIWQNQYNIVKLKKKKDIMEKEKKMLNLSDKAKKKKKTFYFTDFSKIKYNIFYNVVIHKVGISKEN